MQTISVMDEVMKYFYFCYIPIYALLLATVLAFVLSLAKHCPKKYVFLLDLLCIISLGSELCFLGVLADNGGEMKVWGTQSWIMLAVAIILGPLQVILSKRRQKRKEEKKILKEVRREAKKEAKKEAENAAEAEEETIEY